MDVLKAFLLAFLPIGVLTFGVTYYAYKDGVIHPDDEEDDDWDTAIDDALDEARPSNNYLHQKWLSFGGGYYGLMALLTFCVIEVQQIFDFVTNFPGWQALRDMLNINDLVNFFVDQMMNLVDAFIWFFYWPDRIDMANGWVWLGLSYAGFYLGDRLARRFV
jgi:hypothetical protein